MKLDNQETALVLAGLRLLQREMIDGGDKYLPLAIVEILDGAEIGEGAISNIDRLCDKINDDGL